MSNIKDKLSNLTDNFTIDNKTFRLFNEDDKNDALDILSEFYENVNAEESTKDGRDCWIVKASSLIPIGEDAVEENEPQFDIGADDFDMNPKDDVDLGDLGLDSIDDSSEVDDANEITLLKKKAFDLSTKWKETFQRINELAHKMDLVAVSDEDLNITLKKMTGVESKFEDDLNTIDRINQIEQTRSDDSVDDSFGPSEFDDTANAVKNAQFSENLNNENNNQLHPHMVVESHTAPIAVNEEIPSFNSNDPDELKLDECDVDDDF